MTGGLLPTDAKIRVRNRLPEGIAVEVERDRLWAASIDRWAEIKTGASGLFDADEVASFIETCLNWNRANG